MVLLGPSEQKHVVRPNGAGTETFRQRRTLSGGIHERSTTWHDPAGFDLRWAVGKLRPLGATVLGASVTNRTEQPCRLREIVLIETPKDSVAVSGNPASWLLSTVGSTLRVGRLNEALPAVDDPRWSGYAGYVPPEYRTDPRWRSVPDYLTLFSTAQPSGLAAGPYGAPRADLRFDCRVTGRQLTLRIVSDMSDVVLAPGETRSAQEAMLVYAPYDTGVGALFAEVAATHGTRAHRGPLFGWCSWYDLLDRITAESILSTVAAARELRDRVPLDVIQIDMGWEMAEGDWRPNAKFPEGLAPIAAEIRKAGSIPGVWLAPLWVNDTATGMTKIHPEWFQRNVVGELAGGPDARYLDPTHPEVQRFLRGVIRDRCRDGFGYFKIDYNEVTRDCRFHDARKTRFQAFRDLYRLYREEMGDAYLLECAGFDRATAGIVDAARVGWDSRANWTFGPGKPPISILTALHATGNTAAANGIWYANDPDVTYLKPRDTLTEEELRTWHGFVGLLGGASMISEPLASPEHRARLRMAEILRPPVPEPGRPFQGGADEDHQQFGFIARRDWGDFAVVQLWNGAEEARVLSLPTTLFADLGEQLHAWSFWDEHYLGIVGPDFRTRTVEPHACVLLRLTPATSANDPAIVGSNLHIGCGAAEISLHAAGPRVAVVELNDGGAREGALWVRSNRALSLRSAVNCDASIQGAGESMYKVACAKRRMGVGQRIELQIG